MLQLYHMKKVNLGLKYGIAALGVGILIAYFFGVGDGSMIQHSLGTIFLAFVPDIFRLLGIKVSKQLEFWFYLFIIVAMVVGIDFNVYKMSEWYDKVVHGASGVLAAFVANELLQQSVKIQPGAIAFLPLFTISFVAFSAVGWECFEFLIDQTMGGSMQQLIRPGVEDTMFDMISAMIGGVIGTSFILLPKLSRKSK